MYNLFSIFDPNNSMYFSFNWYAVLLPLLFFPKMFWFKQTNWFFCFKLIIFYLFFELKKLIKPQNFNNIIFFLTIFSLFILMNFIGLFPYIFTPSSHLTITLPISLSIWLSIMIFSWTQKTNIAFAHLVPLGTPSLLMSFMVLIETISNFIRPGTLAVRLSANMIAGHLLLCLLGSTGPNSKNLFILLILFSIQIILFLLEMAVSLIQSYVFMMLSSLYSNEI